MSPPWKLISQGAEARVWHVPSFISSSVVCEDQADGDNQKKKVISAVCKERFPKKYRNPVLDASILKSRTKSEVKCLVRCRRGGVPCPMVYGSYMNMSMQQHMENTSAESLSSSSTSSMCIFLEHIPGIPVREFLDQVTQKMVSYGNKEVSSDSSDEEEDSPTNKKHRSSSSSKLTPVQDTNDCNSKILECEKQLKLAAYAIGSIISKMHNVSIVHGDLTTSNIMLRNPPTDLNNDNDKNSKEEWKPDLVMIDFGLAGAAGSKGGVTHEEKAVDLYVLERAIESTHPTHRKILQKEIFRAYKACCSTSDSVLQRLAQVRLRGRKRECFG